MTFNLPARGNPEGPAHAKASFRGLIELAFERSASFFLTEHRWEMREPLRAAYTRPAAFFARKLASDPALAFRNGWLAWLQQTIG